MILSSVFIIFICFSHGFTSAFSIKSLHTTGYDFQCLFKDMGTVFITNALSDVIAQVTENRQSHANISSIKQATSQVVKLPLPEYDIHRTKRFAVFGFFDGGFGHTWFLLLDQFIPGSSKFNIIQKLIADTTIFTSLWCAWFLVLMGLLDGSLIKKIKDNRLGKEYRELYALSVGYAVTFSYITYMS